MDDPFRIPQILHFVVKGIELFGWLMLIFFSRRHWANFWVAGVATPLLMSATSIYLLIVFWFQPPPGDIFDFLSLEGMYGLFANSGLLLAALIKAGAMNLVVGAWMARKAAQTRMPAIYLIPCLIVTNLFAGFGYPLFFIAMAFGERWGAIAKLEKAPPVKNAVFPAHPAAEGVTA